MEKHHTDHVAVDEHHDAETDDQSATVLDDVLIEEISIDGMCGVY